ncbi:MAG: glycosyltransferase [Lachnospiraceae bacterium]|nr:glycosyltransferase [Lachnospiraceae bacterium]
MVIKMKISTIIPVYNAEKYIRRCLDSILGQDIEPQEIICVDDGSTDHSLDILRSYEKTHDNIHVITQKNCYAGIARNHGLKLAKGEYVHFMDADDYVLPGSYAKVYETAKKHAADYVKTRSKTFDMQSGLLTERNYFSLSGFPESIYGKVCSLSDCQDVLLKTARAPWTSFIKRSYLIEHNIKFNSLRCVNDRSFYMDVIMHTNRIVICNCYMTCYQINNKESLMGIRSDNFICLMQSYQIIKDLVADMPDNLRKKVLGYEFNSLAGRYAKLGTSQRKEVDSILLPFLKDFNWSELDGSILTASMSQPLYELLGIEFPSARQIKDLAALTGLYASFDKIALYGAGKVCHALIQYLNKRNDMQDKIACIIVSDQENNPDNLMGVPVRSVEKGNLSADTVIIIATFENVQLPIYHGLSSITACDVWGMTDALYEQLLQENS